MVDTSTQTLVLDDYKEDYSENLIDENETFDDTQITLDENFQKLLEQAAICGGIFRANPQIFVEEYLNIKLKDFQKVLLWEMVHNNYGMYVASRGQGGMTCPV